MQFKKGHYFFHVQNINNLLILNGITMNITYNMLNKQLPCYNGEKWFKSNFPNGANILDIAKKCNNIDYIGWFFCYYPEYCSNDLVAILITKKPDCIETLRFWNYSEYLRNSKLFAEYFNKIRVIRDANILLKQLCYYKI